MRKRLYAILLALPVTILPVLEGGARPQAAGDRAARLRSQVTEEVANLSVLSQQMVDSIYSFAELGFQEEETSRYCVETLRRNGFSVETGVAGIPTAWTASWGSGRPVIALGSDIDCIPQASQKPGVAYHDPLIDGAPGHGEGHNSGVPLNITAALAVKKLMERDRIPGTIRLWPGVAEELVATKAYYVRDGVFRDVDAVLFCHVSADMGVAYGAPQGTGLVSVEYTFRGSAAHAAGAPWRGRSALDGVELMNIGWNFKREHLRLQQRSHYVITAGGDQPNVVPPLASVWYYFREIDYPHIKQMWDDGTAMAEAAARMTGTTVTSRVLGSAWPQHLNKPISEAMYENIKAVGMPEWSEADQALAKALQKEIQQKEQGLNTKVGELGKGVAPEDNRGGGSDDIGDVSWTVPTVTLRYPANIPGTPGHSWISGVAMATPIAHKGVTAGAKVMALTLLDLLLDKDLVEKAWAYFRDVQTKETKYVPLVGATDKPAVELNRRTMEQYRPEMRKYYYDPSKYRSYLEQLGIAYPTVRKN